MDRLTRLVEQGRVRAISPSLASALNRSDLGGYNPAPIADPYSGLGWAAGPAASTVSAAASLLDSGRISAGMVGLLVIGAGGFYLWTRKFQS